MTQAFHKHHYKDHDFPRSRLFTVKMCEGKTVEKSQQGNSRGSEEASVKEFVQVFTGRYKLSWNAAERLFLWLAET